MAKMRNAVKLRGDVVDVDGHSLKILTKQTRPSGTYEDEHLVIVPKAAQLKGIKKGAFVEVMAQLDRDDQPFSTQVSAVSVEKVSKNLGYYNRAELIGVVPFSAAMLPADDGKVSLVNLSVQVAGKVFNGVAFRALAAVFDRVWIKGATAMLGGRIRRREFIDNNGDNQVSVEIVAEDKAEARVLKKAKLADEFGNFGLIDEETPEEDAASVTTEAPEAI